MLDMCKSYTLIKIERKKIIVQSKSSVWLGDVPCRKHGCQRGPKYHAPSRCSLGECTLEPDLSASMMACDGLKEGGSGQREEDRREHRGHSYLMGRKMWGTLMSVRRSDVYSVLEAALIPTLPTLPCSSNCAIIHAAPNHILQGSRLISSSASL